MSSGALVRVPGLQELLDQCQRRMRIHSLLRGSAETLCVLIAAVVFGCLVDYLIPLPGLIRLGLLVVSIVLTIVVVWRRLVSPLLADAPEDELGAAVDLRFPELHESLATLISLEDPNATSGETGSILMRQRLQQYVNSQISSVRPSEVVRSRTTVHRMGLAISSVVALMIPLIVWPSGSKLLMQRFVMPFANLAAPSNLYFEIPDGNRAVATGSDVQFVAIPHWRTESNGALPTDVELEMRGASGSSEELPMMFDEAEAQYSVAVADVRQSLQYRVAGGGAQTEWFQLTVADPPRIMSAVLQETPPVYTGRPIEHFDGVVGDIHVFERSSIEIALTFNKPVQRVSIDWKNWDPIAGASTVEGAADLSQDDNQNLLPEEIAAGKLEQVHPNQLAAPNYPAVLSPDGMAAVFKFEALGGGEFEFRAEDALGLENSSETARRLIVTTDTPPELKVTGLADGLEVRPDDIVPVDCLVLDDIGVGVLELHWRKNSDATRIQPADPFDRGAREVSHAFRFDLTTLQVKAGDVVTFRIRAADERPDPAPQVVWKGPWTIRIADDAEPLGQKPLREADQQLIDSLRALEEQLQLDAEKGNELNGQAQRQWNEQAKEEARALSEKEQTQGRELQQLAEQVAQHPLMQKQAQKLTDLAQQIRQDIPKKLDEAAAAERDPAARRIQESVADLHRIREELHRVTDEVQQVAQLEQELAELNRLALEAQQLARDSQELQDQRAANRPEAGQSPEELQQQLAQQQQQLQQEQQQLEQDLNSLLQRKQELLQAAREAQLEQVAEVAEQVKRLAEQEQRLADGVNEEARDAARDAQELANELQKTRDEADRLGQQIQEQAQDVPKPMVEPLDDAVRDLRQGNLATPQEGIEKVQQELSQASEKLSQPVESKPPGEAADASGEAAQKEEERQLAEQNEERQELGEKAEAINERLEQLSDQLAEMAAELGAKPEAADVSPEAAQSPDQSAKAENGNAAQPESAQPNPGEPQENAQERGPNNAGEQPENQAAQAPESKPSSDAAEMGRSLVDQLEQMAEAAGEQAEAVNADAKANNSAKQHAEQAAERADQAMQHAEAGQFNRAAEQMRNTARESSSASEQLQDPAQQDRSAQLQQQSSSFNRMSDVFQRMQEENAAQVAAQQESQRDVAQSAAELPNPLNELAERLNIPALGMQHLARPAQEAAEAAQQAAASGNQAADRLDQTQLQQAGQAAQETAGHLNRAAHLAQQASQGRRDPNAVIPTEVGDSVADALQSLQKASELMNQEGSEQAGQQPANGSGEAQPPQGQPDSPGQQSGDQAGQPSASGQPSEGEPGQGEPGQGQPGQGQPGQGQPGQGQPGQGQPGQGQPGQGQPGQANGTPKNTSAQQMARAAKALESAARGTLPNQFSPGELNSEGSNASSDPQGKGNPAEFDGRNPNTTQRKGKSRLWGALQDELGGDVGDAGKGMLDNEYAELIRRYRRDLARTGDQDAAKKPKSKE